MIKISTSFFIPDDELLFTYIRASGPGGQNVNKVSSAVQLRFDVRNSPSLTDEVKSRLIILSRKKMTRDGVLVIEAKRYRSQEKNRSDAEQRFTALLQKALVRPKYRRPTRPTAASKMRRMETKKRKAQIKRLRQSPAE